MDQMIVVVLGIVALCWGVRVMPGKPVTAGVRPSQGFSLRRVRARRWLDRRTE